MNNEERVLDYNALGQAIDTTWGRSSTTKGASQSVKFKIVNDDKLEACFVAVVNLVNDQEMIDLKKRYAAEAKEAISAYVKRIKETYKEISESNLKLKQVAETDSFEILDLNIYNRKRTAYFRYRIVYEMS